jgi:hypothetical protein
MHENDELVYPLNVGQASVPVPPALKLFHAVPGKKSPRFEVLLSSVFCIDLVDTLFSV